MIRSESLDHRSWLRLFHRTTPVAGEANQDKGNCKQSACRTFGVRSFNRPMLDIAKTIEITFLNANCSVHAFSSLSPRHSLRVISKFRSDLYEYLVPVLVIKATGSEHRHKRHHPCITPPTYPWTRKRRRLLLLLLLVNRINHINIIGPL